VTADGDRSRAKPEPTLYLEALRTLGISASEAVAFEDSPNGVRAAKRAGLFCVAVPNPVTATLALDEADVVVDTLADLPLDEQVALRPKRSRAESAPCADSTRTCRSSTRSFATTRSSAGARSAPDGCYARRRSSRTASRRFARRTPRGRERAR